MPTFSLDNPLSRQVITDQLKADIDSFCQKEFTEDHRTHLGASLIGKECSREIWYDFRWCAAQVWDGRMLRLFNRGKIEEELIIKYLRGIGCKIWEVDPETGKQFRIWGVSGHYGGSADSVGILPYIDEPMLLEFKTHNSKSFLHLLQHKVIKSKPQHYSQMCAYGKHYNFTYGLYIAVNKNDDDIYPEIVELDWKQAFDLENKAADIINAEIPPPRIAENSSYFACKYCSKHAICWDGKAVDMNCRSCKNAKPIEDKQWFCQKWNAIIPQDWIAKGCPQHDSINQ